MLEIGFHNIIIELDDHDDLLKNRKDIEVIKKYLSVQLSEVRRRSKKGLYPEDCGIALQLGGKDHLVVYVVITRANNPYLFFFNIHTEEVSTKIPYERFKFLTTDKAMGMLEFKLKNLGTQKFRKLLKPETIARIEALMDEYDSKITTMSPEERKAKEISTAIDSIPLNEIEAEALLPPGDDPIIHRERGKGHDEI